MKKLFFSLFGLLTMGNTPVTHINGKPLEQMSVYDFTMKSLEGQDIALSKYKGKVLIIVNTASKCGLTPQYTDLEAFYKANKEKGIEVLGFPADNFMHQEPGSDADIKEFCTKNYGVSFQMFSKISVKGKDIHPLYQYLTSTTKSDVKWNFQKYLVGKDGKVITSFAPTTSINDKEVTAAIAAALK